MADGYVARLLIISACLAIGWAIPASLVDEIKSTELRDNKVKRTPSTAEENPEVPYINKPSAIKRGTNLKNPNPEQQILNEWSQLQDQSLVDSLSNIPASLYNPQGSPYDDKTIAEYEKGLQYGSNKDRLDEVLENAVLKSELYGEPTLNQYRYYGPDDRKRRRRAVKKVRLNPRMKREVELTPEEIITILNLYEKSRQPESPYKQWHNRYENPYGAENFEDNDNTEENWLENPVYPHINRESVDNGPQYLLDDATRLEKRGRWGNYADKKKRFMVAKKRNDPTRELRYLNGPNQNDYYVLSRLLNNQREPDEPVYHRLFL